MAFMENAQELIGILQAISIVAKSLAAKLMRIEQQVSDYYHAWEPLFSHLRATAIYGIITLESHHYI